MIPITEYSDRDVAVYGLGRSGLATAKALMAGGARVHAWDDGEEARTRAEASGITVSDLNKRDWQKFAALILSPGIPYRFPKPHRLVRMAEMMNIPVIGDIELFARAVQALPVRGRPKLIGITGTNGKSTTTALIGHILQEAGLDVRIGGNIGAGVLGMEPISANAVYVLELSSYQLDLTNSLRCDVAVFLNLSPDHLDRHGGLEGYFKAKKRIFKNQQASDVAVIGVDDLHGQKMGMGRDIPGQARIIPVSANFGLACGISAVDGYLYDSLTSKAMRIGELSPINSLQGQHNYQNAAAAYAACLSLGVSPARIIEGMRSFPGLAHRMEFVGEINGIRFINDSKATNAKAAEQALKTWQGIHWIGGGVAKAEGIEPLRPWFSQMAAAYLIGESQDEFAAVLSGNVDTQTCGTLEVAIRKAYEAALNDPAKGGIVLLSPACASFDQYKDFEARGDAFREHVETLKQEVTTPQAAAG